MGKPERMRLLAGGCWLVDHVKVIDRYPELDGLCRIEGESVCNGGGPFNLLVDLARMEAPFELHATGLVGEDDNGRLILELCRRHGINTSRLRTTTAAPTSYTDVMSERTSGRRVFFHQKGTNAIAGEKDFSFRGIASGHFHYGYLLLLDRMDEPGEDGLTGAARLLRAARAAGLTTSADLVTEVSARVPAVVKPVVPFVDLLFLNEAEAGAVLGRDLRPGGRPDLAGCAAAAEAIRGLGAPGWVVLHFAEGVVAAGPGGRCLRQGAVRLPRERVAGAAGAGDALAAGVLSSFLQGRPMETALREGVAAAAACVTDPTTSGGLRPIAECLELLDTHGAVELTAEARA